MPSQRSQAPNASPSRDCPRHCTRDLSLDPVTPRPKGSRGISHSFPPHVSVSAPSSSRVKMNRGKPLPLIAFRLIFCIHKNPVKGLSGTADPLWVEDKERPLTGSQPQNTFPAEQDGNTVPAPATRRVPSESGVGGQSPLNGSRDLSLVGVEGQTAPTLGEPRNLHNLEC